MKRVLDFSFIYSYLAFMVTFSFSVIVRWGVGLERKYIVMYLYKTFLWVYLALPAHVELWPLLV